MCSSCTDDSACPGRCLKSTVVNSKDCRPYCSISYALVAGWFKTVTRLVLRTVLGRYLIYHDAGLSVFGDESVLWTSPVRTGPSPVGFQTPSVPQLHGASGYPEDVLRPTSSSGP